MIVTVIFELKRLLSFSQTKLTLINFGIKMFFGIVLTHSDKKETSLTFDGNETCKADDKITDIGGDIDDIY